MEINSNWFSRHGPEKSSPKIRPAIFGSGSLGFRIWEVKDRSYASQTSTEIFHEKGLLFPKKLLVLVVEPRAPKRCLGDLLGLKNSSVMWGLYDYMKPLLIGCWTNPVEKYAHAPNGTGIFTPHDSLIFCMVNVGEYTSPMHPMGREALEFFFGRNKNC